MAVAGTEGRVVFSPMKLRRGESASTWDDFFWGENRNLLF